MPCAENEFRLFEPLLFGLLILFCVFICHARAAVHICTIILFRYFIALHTNMFCCIVSCVFLLASHFSPLNYCYFRICLHAFSLVTGLRLANTRLSSISFYLSAVFVFLVVFGKLQLYKLFRRQNLCDYYQRMMMFVCIFTSAVTKSRNSILQIRLYILEVFSLLVKPPSIFVLICFRRHWCCNRTLSDLPIPKAANWSRSKNKHRKETL